MRPSPKQLPALPGAPLPPDLRDMLDPGRIRDLDDVSDLVSGMIRAFCEGDIDIRRSKEVRQWTQLLFTSVAAKNPKQEASVNLITQLISLDTPQITERTTIDVVSTQSDPANDTTDRVNLLEERFSAPQLRDTSGAEPQPPVFGPELLEIE